MSIGSIFEFIDLFEVFLWSFAGFPIIIGAGLFFSIKSNFFQFRNFPNTLKEFISKKSKNDNQMSVIQAFFASVGGAVGIGNISGICIAIKAGGPGAVFWVWVTAIFGILLKYIEVYLGLKFVKNGNGMIGYLEKVFPKSIVILISIMFCLYGIEIYQFNVVRDSISDLFRINSVIASVGLISLVVFTSLKGLNFVGRISYFIVITFVSIYISSAFITFIHFKNELLWALKEIFTSAFTGSAAVGGFLGSSFLTTASAGIARGCYATDVGIGYSAIIYGKTNSKHPKKTASCILLEPLFDAFGICSISMLLVLATGTWKLPISASSMVAASLSKVIPFSEVVISLMIITLGFSTLTAFMASGVESAKYLSKKYGKLVYMISGSIIWLIFSFFEPETALSFMSIIGCLILLSNVIAFFALRDKIDFE